MTEPIPMVDLKSEVAAHWPELSGAVEQVLRSGWFIGGPNVSGFEDEFAAHLGVKEAVSCNSGSDALVIALDALGVGEGDEVITTPFTFVATGSAILRVGATPVFADIDPNTFNLSTSAVEAALSPNTKAILPVHLFGLGAPMGELMALAKRRNLVVVEDVAQALGARTPEGALGTIGHAAAFSFFPSKNLGAYGDGGMVLVRDDEARKRARMFKSHGAAKKYFNEILGVNSRLDALQAAILRVKLPYLVDWTRKRRQAAERYEQLLSDLPVTTPSLPTDVSGHSFHQYTLRVPAKRRASIQQSLKEGGVASMIYYPKLLPRMPLFDAHAKGAWPHADAACREVLSLPIWPGISEEQQARVADGLRSALS